MALNRAWYNALVDDDGSNTVGTVWGKDDIKNLLDSVDAEIARMDLRYTVPACILANSTELAWGTGVVAPAPLAGEVYDPGGMHSGGDSRIYIPSPGLYCCNFTAQWGNNPTGTRQGNFRANNSFNFPFTHYLRPADNGFCLLQMTALVQFVTGNYTEFVEAMMYQDSGVTLNFAPSFVRFEVYQVRGNY